MTGRRPLLGTLVAGALVLAACSTSEAGVNEPTTSSSPAPTTTAPPSTIAPVGSRTTFSDDRATATGLGDVAAYGRGISIVDIDGDGDNDVWASDTDTRNRGDDFGVSRVYRNDGGGTFTPWDLGIAIDDQYATSGGIFGDYDNDGQPDLLIVNGNNAAQSHLALYQNRLRTGEGFVDVTEASTMPPELESWWGGAWVDVNVDGFLDIIVTGSRTALLINDGAGGFTDQTEARGLGPWLNDPIHKNPIVLDLDNDGWPDLASGGGSPAGLFHNDGTGNFTEVTDTAYPKDLPKEWWLAGFNGGAQDFNQDGWDDIYLGRFWYQDFVLLNEHDGTFSKHATDVGIVTKGYDESEPFFGGQTSGERSSGPTVPTTWLWVGDYVTGERESENTMGPQVGDLDDDGSPDIFVGTGDPSSANTDIIFCGSAPGDGTVEFERCHPEITTVEGRTRMHGVAFGDVNHDGATDLITNPGGWPTYDSARGLDTREHMHLFLGATPPEPVVSVRLRTHGREAYGAQLTSEVSPPRYATVRTSQGFQSQNSTLLRLPVGTKRVTVRWPGGATSSHDVVADADGRMVIDQPDA